ncbi:MFS transporter [Demequina pelophila]|uniref:MFS transporter n=1 Tax=Demequina pelophila TaxID=1638984 RepID=UPI000786340D|nr:MFS transporter [Demequina pelophila]
MTALPPTRPSAQPRWLTPRTSHAAHPAWVLASMVLAAFGIGLTQAGAGAVIQDQVRSLSTTVDMIGYTHVAYALGVVVGGPLFMIWLARWDRRHLLLAMSGIFVVTSALTVITPNVGVLLGVRLFAGLPHGALLGTAVYMAVRAVGPERRGQGIATLMYGLTAASIVGVPGMQWISEAIGWRASYGVVTLVGLASLALMWAFVPQAPGAEGGSARSELAALRGPLVATAVIAVIVGFTGLGAVQSYMVPLFEESNGFSPATVTLVLALFGVGMTLGAVMGGRLTDWSVTGSARVALLGVVASLAALLVLGTHGWWAVAALVSLGAWIQTFAQAAQAHLMDVVHTSPSLGAAIAHSSFNAATVVGSGLGAVVIGLGWGFVAPVGVALPLACIALVVVMVGPGFRRS